MLFTMVNNIIKPVFTHFMEKYKIIKEEIKNILSVTTDDIIKLYILMLSTVVDNITNPVFMHFIENI